MRNILLSVPMSILLLVPPFLIPHAWFDAHPIGMGMVFTLFAAAAVRILVVEWEILKEMRRKGKL